MHSAVIKKGEKCTLPEETSTNITQRVSSFILFSPHSQIQDSCTGKKRMIKARTFPPLSRLTKE